MQTLIGKFTETHYMARKKKIVSVIIVTYNVQEKLQKCLDSIFEQECDTIEIIVIDGASSDGTKSILEKNKDRIDHWISEKDSSIFHAMNKGLKFVSTERIHFLGADDLLLPDFSKILPELEDPHTIYYSNVIYKDEKHSGFITAYNQAKSGIFHQSIIYPSSVFKKYQYNENYKVAADYALNMICHGDPEFTFKYLEYTIAHYNDTGISSYTVDTAFEKHKSMLILKNFGMKIWLRYRFRILKAKLKSAK